MELTDELKKQIQDHRHGPIEAWSENPPPMIVIPDDWGKDRADWLCQAVRGKKSNAIIVWGDVKIVGGEKSRFSYTTTIDASTVSVTAPTREDLLAILAALKS